MASPSTRISRSEEDEEDSWVPLTAERNDDPAVSEQIAYATATAASTAASTTTGGTGNHPRRERQQRSSSDSSGNNSNKSNGLDIIQQRLEAKVAIQSNLVNHPVDLFWKRFLINFIREIWALEVRIRLGLFMLLAGLLIRIFIWSAWYILYPKVAILTLIFVGSFIYLDPLEVQSQLKTIGEILFVSPENAIQAIERLDLQHFRRLSLFLFMIPTLAEIRTLSFLSQIKAEAGWTIYNICIGGCLLGTMLFLMQKKGMKPRDVTYQGMLILYGSALLITIFCFDIRRMPLLAAPFLTSTGTLLLTYHDDDMEWISRIIRHTLRLTLRDVLSSVGERVSESEMLQLAILRWISDYWTGVSSDASSSPQTQQEPTNSQSTSQPDSSSASHTTEDNLNNQNDSVPSNTATPLQSSSSSSSQLPHPTFEPHDVQWDELLPMLNVEIDHMEAEVEELQSNNDIPAGAAGQHSSTTSPNASTRPSQPSSQPNTDSFDSLKSMLLELNIDERARPAVMAYRRAVESFPPEKRTAVAISILRRCPAVLTLMFHILFGGTKSLFTSCVILVPFVLMEYFRIVGWMMTCQLVAPVTQDVSIEKGNVWGIPRQLENVDTMVILLCGDFHSPLRPPTLLLVWHNIVSSVSAMEVGLTAARCAETTAVAVEFAGNIMSLVQFGFEVSERGLLYGLGVVVKEAISIHGSGGDYSNLDNMDNTTAQYTKAAVRAIHSGQRVARNIHMLSEDEHVGAVVQPLLAAAGFLSGHGWLWGKDDQDRNSSISNSNESGVVIEEIVDGEKDCGNNSSNLDRAKNNEPSSVSSPQDVPKENHERSFNAKNEEDEILISSDTAEQENQDQGPAAASPQDDLSCVMEMVASAYEQQLIEESEKIDFYEKLSKLSETELYNPAVLFGMKRTLAIILENGSMASPIESIEDGDNETRNTDDQKMSVNAEEINPKAACQMESKEVDAVATGIDPQSSQDLESLRIDDIGQNSPPIQAATTSDSSQAQERLSGGDSNDALFKFGAAALGVVAGGILLSMAGNKGAQGNAGNDHSEENRNSSYYEENSNFEGTNRQSNVVIEELNDDDGDDEWVSVSQ